MKTDEFIEKRILWRATKGNVPNRNVHIYTSIPAQKRLKYSSVIDKVDAGKVVLLYVGRRNVWTAVGTKMIIGFDGEKVNSVRVDNIKKIESKKMKALPSEPTRWTRLPKRRNENALIVTDKDGKELTFLTTKGENLFSLWSILLMLQRLNTKVK